MILSSTSKKELLEYLRAAVDGIDGYESENGDLRYWDSEKIIRARDLISKLKDCRAS